jgi:hypothetical protein
MWRLIITMMIVVLIGIMPLATLAIYPLYQTGNGVAEHRCPVSNGTARALVASDGRGVRKRRAAGGSTTNPSSIPGSSNSTITGDYHGDYDHNDYNNTVISPGTTKGNTIEVNISRSDMESQRRIRLSVPIRCSEDVIRREMQPQLQNQHFSSQSFWLFFPTFPGTGLREALSKL